MHPVCVGQLHSDSGGFGPFSCVSACVRGLLRGCFVSSRGLGLGVFVWWRAARQTAQWPSASLEGRCCAMSVAAVARGVSGLSLCVWDDSGWSELFWRSVVWVLGRVLLAARRLAFFVFELFFAFALAGAFEVVPDASCEAHDVAGGDAHDAVQLLGQAVCVFESGRRCSQRGCAAHSTGRGSVVPNGGDWWK